MVRSRSRRVRKQFPGVLEKYAGPGAQPHYVCPICTAGFVRADVSSGVFTEEHVPPESLGGHGLVLTCEPCNSRSGTKLDAHAHHRKKVQETIQGAPMVEPLKVKATIGDVTLNARLKATGGQKGELVIPPGINNPQLVTVARELFRTDHKVTIEYSGDRYSELAANISWLRSAYLSAFALFGYRVVFDPAMEIVRRQILENDRRLMVSFLTNLPVTGKWPPPVLARLLSPPVQGGLLALFGPHGVLLPGPGDMSFYDRIAADVERPQHAPTTAQVIGWPIQPAFGETSL